MSQLQLQEKTLIQAQDLTKQDVLNQEVLNIYEQLDALNRDLRAYAEQIHLHDQCLN